MSKAERRLVRQWEEQLIADYDDYLSHQLLDPLYAQFQQWKEGALNNDELFDAIHKVHKENRERYTFLVQRRPDLVRNIQFNPWFETWLEAHPAPVGADLLPEEVKSDRWEEMEEQSAAEESASMEVLPPGEAEDTTNDSAEQPKNSL